jgi:hypothetical protein
VAAHPQLLEALALGLDALIREHRLTGMPVPLLVSTAKAELDELVAVAHLVALERVPQILDGTIQPDPDVKLLSVRQTAKQIARSEGYVRRLVRQGRLVAHRGAKGEWVISPSSLLTYATDQALEPTG